VQNKWIILIVFVFVFGAAAYLHVPQQEKCMRLRQACLLIKEASEIITDIGYWRIGDDKDIQNEMEGFTLKAACRKCRKETS